MTGSAGIVPGTKTLVTGLELYFSPIMLDYRTHLRNKQSSETAGVVLCRLLYPYGETGAVTLVPNEV